MPSPLSVDLRERVVAAVAAGASCHRAAARFGVSVSSASRWSERFRQEKQLAPKPIGGDHTSQRIEARAALILATSKQKPRLFLRELRDRLAEQGVRNYPRGGLVVGWTPAAALLPSQACLLRRSALARVEFR
ncbi:hypothetical protein AEGHOMDF_2936 [Methylobacterium soli]|nr:hypothetical protein AEGHOMDF_2936 [Methylobacterium soli]